MKRSYCVYILASRSRTLYTGVTNDLEARVRQHREGKANSFAARYRIHRLVYFEVFGDIREAIKREKQIKHWVRAERVALIEAMNPTWRDLAEQRFPSYPRTEEKQKRIPHAKTAGGMTTCAQAESVAR
jgi:putative endonuclease